MNKSISHILLVEDEKAHAELLNRAFESHAEKFGVTVAGSLEEARQYLSESTPNLVITDLFLPDGRGTELLHPERVNHDFPLVVMTSHGDEQAAVEAIKAGALDYVVKSDTTLADMPHIAERNLREWGHIVERKRMEEALRKRTHELDERIRELNCLYGMSNLIEKPDISLEEILQGTADLIPLSWQYPEETCARVILEGQEFKTENFTETIWKQKSNIIVYGKWIGSLEVYYLVKKPERDEGPFLKEERSLINAIAGRLGRIIEHRRAEEALRESEAKWRSVTENSPDYIITIDLDGNILFINRTVPWLTVEEVIGKPIFDYVPEEFKPIMKESYERVTKTKEPDQYEVEYRGPDGTTRSFETRVGPVFKSGQVVALITSSRDVSERQRLEAQLLQAQKMEAIATLAGGIAHEFNNALVGVVGNIELLQMDLPDDENVKKYAELMKVSTQRMVHLTNQLLAYARGGKYQPQEISLIDFVEYTLPLIKREIDPSIHVKTDLLGINSNVEIDLTQMQMVLSAVLNNSAEAIEDKGRILIHTEDKVIDEDFAKNHQGLKPGNYVCITIEDNGKGMDKETRKRIFEPFFTKKFQGRGLGMAAAYGIVKNHDGWISVYSELGRGTVVHIYLPVIESEKKEVEKPKIEPIKDAGTILVIEDEAVVMDVSRTVLERLGYRVFEAYTGKQAIDIAKTLDEDIDIAILDIVLPDLDARKLYLLLVEIRPNLKVLVCSGYSIEGPAEEILNAGAQSFIQKPFTIAALSEKLRELLDNK